MATRERGRTRRVAPRSTELQDRFSEHRCPALGESAWTARCLHESDQAHRGFAALLRSGPTHVGHRRRHRRAEPSCELHGDRRPTLQERALRSVVGRSARSVSIQSLEIKHPRSEPEHPELYGARHHACLTGDTRPRGAIDKRLPDRIQNQVDACHLSRQRFERQHPLAVPTLAAPRESDLAYHGFTEKLEPALDPTPSKSQIAAPARSAPTPCQQLVARRIDDGRVLARLNAEYDNHVLVTAPGMKEVRGRRLFGASHRYAHACDSVENDGNQYARFDAPENARAKTVAERVDRLWI